MTASHVITNLKSPKQILARKALIAGAAVAGVLIATGAVLFAVAAAQNENNSEDLGSTDE
jgi:hypothetical protein